MECKCKNVRKTVIDSGEVEEMMTPQICIEGAKKVQFLRLCFFSFSQRTHTRALAFSPHVKNILRRQYLVSALANIFLCAFLGRPIELHLR